MSRLNFYYRFLSTVEVHQPGDHKMADTLLNLTPTFTSTHVFSTDDVTGTFDGLTEGTVGEGETHVVNFLADPDTTTMEGVLLYPINSEFGYNVTDFVGAVEKDFVLDPEYEEGWVGDLTGAGGEQLGLVISNSPTDSFKTPALLGTWLAGLGGETIKASTEHYVVMQNILSDQRYPEDPDAVYQLDDNLKMIGGQYDGEFLSDILLVAADANGDGVVDIKDVLLPNETTIDSNILVGTDYSVTMKDDGKLLYRWGNVIKKPNDVRIEASLDLPDEWTQPTEASGGLIPLFRITQAELVTNHTITNNPNDQIRPEDFENESAIGTLPTYEILPDGKWVTTDDYYAGDGTLYPAGTVLRDPALVDLMVGTTLAETGVITADLEMGFTNAWYTTMDREPFEAVLNEDGTDYIVGPRWRLQPDKYGQDLPSVDIPLDPSLPPPPTKDELKYESGTDTTTVINLLDWEFPVSPLSISAGFQNLSGTTSINGLNMTDNFDVAFYVKGDIKPATLYNTTLVMSYEELAIYGEGVFIAGQAGADYLVGMGGNTFYGDTNTTTQGEDLFVLSYGAGDNWSQILSSTIMDFQVGLDTLGLIDFDVTETNFAELVNQVVTDSNLHIDLNGFEIVVLEGVTEALDYQDFLILNRFIDEQVLGTAQDDYLVGDAFDNKILGSVGNDTLLGLEGNDSLYGGAGDDQLFGGDGNDLLVGAAGADLLDGGAGVDIAGYGASAAAVSVNLDTGVNTGGDAEGDTLVSIEQVLGSAFGDAITGDANANTLTGLAGNDTLDGGEGNDVLLGGVGADFLKGGVGADVLDGGIGLDTVTYAGSVAGVIVDLTIGSATGGDATGDTLISIERIDGSNFADTLLAGAGANVLKGLAGNDILISGDGDDLLFGGLGNDEINGGMGVDRLFGGAGADTFVFTTGDGDDFIQDFLASVDNIKISGAASAIVTNNGTDTLVEYGISDSITLTGVALVQDDITFSFV